jgi:DNA-binding MarR family transcriptional regulator
MIYVTLTEEAKELIKEHEDELRKATMESLSSLTVGELEELSASLRTLREIFSKLE